MRNYEAIAVLSFPLGVWSLELLSLFMQPSPTDYLRADHNLLLLVYLALHPWIMLNSVAVFMVLPSSRPRALFSGIFALFFLGVNLYAARAFRLHSGSLSRTHFALLLIVLVVGFLFTLLFGLIAGVFWDAYRNEREQARLLLLRDELDVEAFQEKFDTLGRVQPYAS